MNERADKIKNIAYLMNICMEDLIAMKNDLEYIGCKKTAKKVDTITGKLENIIYELNEQS